MKKVLGRGLSSLISTPVSVSPTRSISTVTTTPSEPSTDASSFAGNTALKVEPTPEQDSGQSSIRYLPISQIAPDPKQPRQKFSEGELLELAQSIKEKGVIQPLLVRQSKSNSDATPSQPQYEIIAGERRWRASKLAGLTQLPVIINNLSDSEAFEFALIENIQRSNLTPVEEARAYERLATEFALSQEKIAERVGKNRSSVTNSLRLLKLPTEVIELLSDGSLTIGHAKAILSVKDPQAQINLARTTVRDELSVRALESLIAQASVLDISSTAPTGLMRSGKTPKPSTSDELTEKLQRSLATKVTLSRSSTGKGRITIHFYSEDELSRLVEKLL